MNMYEDRCISEMKLLLIFWLLVMLTWLWAGLHMAYQLLWLLVMFCIFNISLVRTFSKYSNRLVHSGCASQRS